MNNSLNPSAKRDALKEKILEQWTSNHTDKRTLALFLFLSIFFTVIGIILVAFMGQATEYRFKYSQYPQCLEAPTCTIVINIEEKLDKPVFFWFELYSFYQNHRQYVKSSNVEETNKEVGQFPEDCYPFFTNREANKTVSVENTSLSPNAPVIPCGIAANTFFNDTFAMKNSKGVEVYLNTTGISYESRTDYDIDDVDLSKQWINMENEHFLNWMRLAGLSTFRKLWAHIDQDVEAGQYSIIIQNNYNITVYNAQKRIIIGTVSKLGGKNVLLIACYLTAAGISWAFVVVFSRKISKERKKRR